MSVRRGRVLRGAAAESAVAASPPSATNAPEATAPARGRVVPRVRVDAERDARAIVAAAEARAAELEGAARARGERLAAEAERAARDAAAAELAAELLLVRSDRARLDAAHLDRVVELARLLAERLVGEVLAVEPQRVVAMARDLAAEARGARRLHIEAHPADADALATALGELGRDARVTADPSLARGSLRLATDAGRVDGRLDVRLERLAVALRAALD